MAVFRLCGPATRALPPLCDIPSSLCIGSRGYMLPGECLISAVGLDTLMPRLPTNDHMLLRTPLSLC